MFIATNRIKVKTGYGDTLEQMFKARGAVQDHPGFISFELWKMNNTPDHEEFLVVTHWETERASPHLDPQRRLSIRPRRRSARLPARPRRVPHLRGRASAGSSQRGGSRLIPTLRAGVHNDYHSERTHCPGRRARYRPA